MPPITKLPTRRLSLECPVVYEADLRTAALAAFGDQEFFPADELHMTVFHVGRTHEVYEAVTQARQDFAHRPLDTSRFAVALHHWLRRSAMVLPRESWVQGRSFQTLGETPYAAVLVLDQLSPMIADVHDRLSESFARFLRDECNVPNGTSLLRENAVFGFSGKSWIPHITVGRVPAGRSIPAPALRVTLGDMRTRNEGSLARWISINH